MKKNKTFDCVEMKDRIQAGLLKEWEGKTGSEIRDEIHRVLDSSESSVARFWRRTRNKYVSPHTVTQTTTSSAVKG